MIAGNLGQTTQRVALGNRAADMEAYDALPAAHRQRLQTMSDRWGAQGVQVLIDKHGPDFALTIMNKIQGDAQAAYQEKLPCPVR